MPKRIIITERQLKKIAESRKKTIIITESQLYLIKEMDKDVVLHADFEDKVRGYMEQLRTNPCKPKFDAFFNQHDIPQDILLKKMTDFGLIHKDDKINEPEDANGEKRSMNTRKYKFLTDDYNDKIKKMYEYFFDNNGKRRIIECDCGSAGGATNAQGVGGQYVLPAGFINRRFLGQTLSRNTKSGISMNRKGKKKKKKHGKKK